MAKSTLELPPFPPLTWDGFRWTAEKATLPWISSSEPPHLEVRSNLKGVTEKRPHKAAPPPSAEQMEAFRHLSDPESRLPEALLPAFLKHVPELEDGDWARFEDFWRLDGVIIFQAALDGVAYVGLDWLCLKWEYAYEHGAGLIVHKGRVVDFGMGGDAIEERTAFKDLRKHKK